MAQVLKINSHKECSGIMVMINTAAAIVSRGAMFAIAFLCDDDVFLSIIFLVMLLGIQMNISIKNGADDPHGSSTPEKFITRLLLSNTMRY